VLKERRKMGIEIEFSGEGTREGWQNYLERVATKHGATIYTAYDNRKGVKAQYDYHLTYDGSVSGIGLELLTRPFALQDKPFIEAFRSILKDIREFGGEIDLSCGLHIHISGHDFLLEHIKRLMSFYYDNERILFSLLHKSRQEGSYCHEMKKDLLKRVLRAKKNSTLASDWGYSRYNSLNLSPWFSSRHYEVRMGHGMLNPQRIINWCCLHGHIAQYVKENDCKLLNYEKMKKTATEKHLKDMLKEIDFSKSIGYFVKEYEKWRSE